jgi:hypothetical protein
MLMPLLTRCVGCSEPRVAPLLRGALQAVAGQLQLQ